jgi:hypothetical protein
VTARVQYGIMSAKSAADRAKQVRIRNFRVVDFAKLLLTVIFPTLDAWSDWGLVAKFFVQGDTSWGVIGLAIQLVSGAISGLCLGVYGYRSRDDMLDEKLALGLGLLCGLTGLAPVASAALVLYSTHNRDDAIDGLKFVSRTKAVLLVCEELPQLVLQVYIGTAYGLLDPYLADFDRYLAFSVCIGLVNAGIGFFGFENDERLRVSRPFPSWNLSILTEIYLCHARSCQGEILRAETAGQETSELGLKYYGGVSLFSRFGLWMVMLRMVQTAAVVFWQGLLGCAVKGRSFILAVLALAALGFVALEGAAALKALRPFWRTGRPD